MACVRCSPYFAGWRSHSPLFSDTDWEITERRDWPIEGPGNMTGFDGKAVCRACGQRAEFTCSVPDGFAFTRT